jgi:GNAT superfamily N-acetyltransferase
MSDAIEPADSISDGARIRLSKLDPAVLDTMPWLDAALAPEWTREDLIAAIRDHDGVLVVDMESRPIGVAVVFRHAPGPRSATIPFLAIDPDRRFRGLGGEAGIALDLQLRKDSSFERVYAPVPEGRGLAVYFWLRLGFRPLSMAEAPKAPLGLTADSQPGIWMLRDSTQPDAPGAERVGGNPGSQSAMMHG